MATRAQLQTTTHEVAVDIIDMHKWYGSFHVLRDINLTVMRGERIVICGPSGSGKSTLIRCINRLEEHQRGRIFVDGVEVTADSRHIDEVRREVGMVFQQFNLFPHLTVLENVALAPRRVRKTPREQAESEGLALLERVGLREHAHKHPFALSGGQQQRVAIARSLAMEPQVMLFDEVTSALDPQLTGEVLRVIEALAQGGMTMVLVTHEMEFAARVADTIIYMHEGKVWETGPGAMLKNPQTAELRDFLSHGL